MLLSCIIHQVIRVKYINKEQKNTILVLKLISNRYYAFLKSAKIRRKKNYSSFQAQILRKKTQTRYS